MQEASLDMEFIRILAGGVMILHTVCGKWQTSQTKGDHVQFVAKKQSRRDTKLGCR